MRQVLVVGGTGLVGQELLRALLGDPLVARVVALGRRDVPAPAGIPAAQRAKLHARVVDFANLRATAGEFAGIDQVFCALGTTIRQAGSRERFREVDHDYPLECARLGLAAGATHFLLVSAVGANPDSRVFYNRVKGQLEQDVGVLGYRCVTIVRPSLLLGDRAEFRPGEAVAKRLAWAFPRRYRPVRARDVARSLVAASRGDRTGITVIESAEITRSRLPGEQDR